MSVPEPRIDEAMGELDQVDEQITRLYGHDLEDARTLNRGAVPTILLARAVLAAGRAQAVRSEEIIEYLDSMAAALDTMATDVAVLAERADLPELETISQRIRRWISG